MKRMAMMVLPVLAACTLLGGCSLAGEENAGQGGDLEKAQEIRAVRAGEEETAYDTTDRDAIEAFVEKLQIGEWKLGELPEDARKRRLYLPTGGHRPVWRNKPDGSMDKMVELTTYDGSPMLLCMSGRSLDFEIPQDARVFEPPGRHQYRFRRAAIKEPPGI
ncbi:MAG: hypothetical protein ACLVDB_01940 [Anaeromassilibacillus sp.]